MLIIVNKYRYLYAVGPTMRSLTTSIVFARFLLHDELTPAFTVSSLIGRTHIISWAGLILGTDAVVMVQWSSKRPRTFCFPLKITFKV